jgi:hypothetical protein
MGLDIYVGSFTRYCRPDMGPARITALPDFHARMAKVFPKALTVEQTRRADKLLAGE